MTTRTPRECEIRWLGEQHREFNREPWSKVEVLMVKSLAAEFTDSRPDWMAVAKSLGVRDNILRIVYQPYERASDETNAARLHAAGDLTEGTSVDNGRR